MQFDAEGRLTKSEASGSREAQTYDARGNLTEWTRYEGEELREGTRWDNRYEGDPPRLTEQDISRFRKPDERNTPHARVRYRYDAEGRVERRRRPKHRTAHPTR